MIRPIDIRLNAAHPELPLAEAVTFTGSPSTVLIRGVPPNCGRWAITAVFVAASFPDGSTTTRAAVQSANGVWVATLPATATSGRTASGIRIMADGVDENGEAVTGYILGVADFAVASLGVAPAPEPGETSYQMLYFDEVPSTLRKGDVAKIDGVLKFYNGTAWEPFAAPITLDDAVTRASANGVKSSGIWRAIWGALASLPTGFSSLYDWCVAQLVGKQSSLNVARVSASGVVKSVSAAVRYHGSMALLRLLTENTAINGKTFTDDVTLTGADIPVDATQGAQKINAALAGKASKADATLTPIYSDTPTFSEWAVVTTPDTIGYTVRWDGGEGSWAVVKPNAGRINTGITDVNAVILPTVLDFSTGVEITATRTRTDILGYVLGSQTDKPLASEVEAEALRTGKANRAANPTAGNLAALDASGNPTDSTIPAANVAVKGEIPYILVTPIVIDTASSEVVEGETVNYGAATLANRTANIVQVTAATALDELRITFPAATSGKVRDFGLRVEIGTGSAALAAPALVPIAPTGETIKIENNAAEIPALANGAATAKGVTLLYFSENAPGVFVVKGEQVEEVA